MGLFKFIYKSLVREFETVPLGCLNFLRKFDEPVKCNQLDLLHERYLSAHIFHGETYGSLLVEVSQI